MYKVICAAIGLAGFLLIRFLCSAQVAAFRSQQFQSIFSIVILVAIAGVIVWLGARRIRRSNQNRTAIGPNVSGLAASGRRPSGLVAIVIYSTLWGLVGSFFGILGMIGGSALESDLVVVLSFFSLALGILLLTAAYGLWTVQRWGLTLARCLYGVAIPLDVAQYLSGEGGGSLGVVYVVDIVVSIAVLLYLFRPYTKELFKKGLINSH